METFNFGCEVPKAGSFKIVEEKPEERPPCPECGAIPISKGVYWLCKSCGRWFTKNRRNPIAL